MKELEQIIAAAAQDYGLKVAEAIAKANEPEDDTREFKMPDDRPVTINRFAVSFCCPAKDEPETKTVVGVKGAASAMPLMIPYAEFKAWWQK
jgi:hypothetical protein